MVVKEPCLLKRCLFRLNRSSTDKTDYSLMSVRVGIIYNNAESDLKKKKKKRKEINTVPPLSECDMAYKYCKNTIKFSFLKV